MGFLWLNNLFEGLENEFFSWLFLIFIFSCEYNAIWKRKMKRKNGEEAVGLYKVPMECWKISGN